jgi:site-specific DNA recombinase
MTRSRKIGDMVPLHVEKKWRGEMKVAAIWARISGPGQQSLPSQIEEVRTWLETQGYVVPHERILAIDWTSTDILTCPQMQTLLRWVQQQEVEAVGAVHLDRLSAKPGQMAQILETLKESGVELILKNFPLPEGLIGDGIALMMTIAKAFSVDRADKGAKGGLRDRAKLRGLPPSPRNLYGYTWDGTRTRLQSTSEWPNASFICRAALEGATLGHIRHELHHRGIPSPTGREWWAKQVIYGMLTNPVYGGRFYALRREEVEPKKRRTPGYGKSSSSRKPITEAHYLPNIVVESPPLKWEEWETIQERFHQNKLLAQRNAKRDYLLRGLVMCETHHRHHHGRPHRQSWCYICPARYEPGEGPCITPYLNGPELEARVKAICRDILTRPEIIEQEIAKLSGHVKATLKAIQRNLAALNTKEAKALATETNLVRDKASGDASPEAYDRALAMVKAQKAWIAEETERLRTELSAAQLHEGVVIGLGEARERLCHLLDRGSNEDWRQVFTALALEIRVGDDGKVEVSLAIPVTQLSIESAVPGHG